MDEDDQNNAEVQDETGQARPVRGIDKVRRFFSNGIRGTAKNARENLSNEVRSGIGFKVQTVRKLKLIGILIIVVIVFCAAAYIVDLLDNADKSQKATNDYYKDKTTSGATLYNKSGSLLLATNEEIHDLYLTGLAELRAKNAIVADYASKKIKKLEKDNSGINLESGAISLDEDVTIYEHCLNAERYNFNRIKWQVYNRDTLVKDSNGKDATPEMIVDTETLLQYPKDDTYTLNDFANMMIPYLQSWVIPYSMYIGIASNTSNDLVNNFAYAIIRDGYSQIVAQKRRIESYNLDTEYKKYTIYKTTTKIKERFLWNDEESRWIYSAEGSHSTSSTEAIGEVDEKDSTSERVVGTNIGETIEYRIGSVEAFDIRQVYNYVYNKYNTNEEPVSDTTTVGRQYYEQTQSRECGEIEIEIIRK